MLFFIAAFYAYFLWLAPDRRAAEEEALSHDAVTLETMKQREARFVENMKADPARFEGVALTAGFLLASGLLLDLYAALRKLAGFRLFRDTHRHKNVFWGLPDVFRLFLLLIFTEVFLIAAEMTAAPFFSSEIPKDLLLMANNLARNVFVAACVVYWVKKRYGEPLSDIGLTLAGFWKNACKGLAAYLTALPPLLALLIAVAGIAHAFGYEPEPQEVVKIYLKDSSDKYLLFFTFFVAIAGPLVEEIFFRGFAYKAFRSRWGVKRAALASTALFAALHLNWAAFFPIFMLGLLFVYLYEKTGSLVPSMTAHVFHNLIMVGLTLAFKANSI